VGDDQDGAPCIRIRCFCSIAIVSAIKVVVGSSSSSRSGGFEQQLAQGDAATLSPDRFSGISPRQERGSAAAPSTSVHMV